MISGNTSVRPSDRFMMKMSQALNNKSPYLAGHWDRVLRVVLSLGDAMNRDDASKKRLALAALLHDIGILQIPDDIFSHSGSLDRNQWEFLRMHPRIGANAVAGIGDFEGLAPIILHHHEHWNGKGYPEGLSGEEIPLESTIISLADAWCAMRSPRSYRKALPFTAARAEILRLSGVMFNPAVVDVFVSTMQGQGFPDNNN